MTKHNLPVLVPGRAEPIDVPCALPESFDFQVFLPSRGIRTFTAWLTTKNPREAEVKDVQLANREGDPRAGMNYDVDDDEQRRADEAATWVLEQVLGLLGLTGPERTPGTLVTFTGSVRPLEAIAVAWDAEQVAVERQTQLCAAMDRGRLDDASRDAYALVPDLTTWKAQDKSPSCVALRGYVQYALDEAVVAQGKKADAQLAEHPGPDDEDAPGSERIRAPRSLDVPTLKCLFPDVDF